MVEILNKGYDECEKCWTGFLYDEEDIVEVPTKVYEEIGFGNKVVAFDTIKQCVKCPKCGYLVEIY